MVDFTNAMNHSIARREELGNRMKKDELTINLYSVGFSLGHATVALGAGIFGKQAYQNNVSFPESVRNYGKVITEARKEGKISRHDFHGLREFYHSLVDEVSKLAYRAEMFLIPSYDQEIEKKTKEVDEVKDVRKQLASMIAYVKRKLH